MDPSDVLMPVRVARLPRDRRGYPVIATVDRDAAGNASFRSLDDARKVVLGIFDWCSVCGLPFGGEDRYLVLTQRPRWDDPPVMRSTEPTVHRICAHYAARVCPFLLTPGRVVRSGPARGTVRRDLTLVGHRTVTGLFLTPEGAAIELADRSRVEALDPADDEAYREVLAAEPPCPMSGVHTELLAMFEQPQPLGVEFAAITLAVFAPNVQVFESIGGLREAATTVARMADLARSRHVYAEEVAVARRWVAECRDALPPLIASSERVRLGLPGERPAVRRGRNDPCPCGSGRKAKFCHGAGRP